MRVAAPARLDGQSRVILRSYRSGLSLIRRTAQIFGGRALKDWFSAIAYTRLMPGGAIAVCATRMHEDDLIGWLEREHASEGWKSIVMPAIAVALALQFGVTGSNLTVVTICSAVPTASSAYVLARQMGGDAPLLAQIITLQTILAAVTMPIAIALVA